MARKVVWDSLHSGKSVHISDALVFVNDNQVIRICGQCIYKLSHPRCLISGLPNCFPVLVLCFPFQSSQRTHQSRRLRPAALPRPHGGVSRGPSSTDVMGIRNREGRDCVSVFFERKFVRKSDQVFHLFLSGGLGYF